MTPENVTSILYLTYREDPMSAASFVFKISLVTGVLFSTSVELQPHFFVTPCTKVMNFQPFDLSETWSEVKGGITGNGDTAGFSVKKSISLIIHENKLKNSRF